MPLIQYIDTPSKFFKAMGERGERYSYEAAEFIVNMYDDRADTDVDPIVIVDEFSEYDTVLDACNEVFDGETTIHNIAEMELLQYDENMSIDDILALIDIDTFVDYFNSKALSGEKKYEGTLYALSNDHILLCK